MSYVLGYADHCLQSQAIALAKHYGFLIDQDVFPRLQLTAEGLCYLPSSTEKLAMNWNDRQWLKRSHGALGKDPLIRACLAKKNTPNILDLTAGWGKDAMLLARAGAHVVLVEKHPVMAALLEDAHLRLSDDLLKSRMCIKWVDAHDYLNNLTELQYPDVIYFDPMHPVRQKTALVKQHLQVLQTLAQPNQDVESLIALARTKCRQRLVLKWPVKGPKFAAVKGSLQGKTIRFDIF